MSNDSNPCATAAPSILRSLVKLLAVLIVLWGLRIIVAFVDVGRFFPDSKLFDMEVYTNPFPLNLLKTPFEFSLTASVLGISMLALALWASVHSVRIHGFLGRVAAGKR
jgi:hypothetical protein